MTVQDLIDELKKHDPVMPLIVAGELASPALGSPLSTVLLWGESEELESSSGDLAFELDATHVEPFVAILIDY